MPLTPNALTLFSQKANTYDRFIHLMGYPSGLRAYFQNSDLLHSGIRVLDAGCGTGVLALALLDACAGRGIEVEALHAFDLTPAMLDLFAAKLKNRSKANVELTQCNVLSLEELPSSWNRYQLIVSASMMEYLPRERLAEALGGLRAKLLPDGKSILFITRRNFITRPLIGQWWQSNLYSADELSIAFKNAGFTQLNFARFPFPYSYLNLWGYIVEAEAANNW